MVTVKGTSQYQDTLSTETGANDLGDSQFTGVNLRENGLQESRQSSPADDPGLNVQESTQVAFKLTDEPELETGIENAKRYGPIIDHYAEQYGVPPQVLRSVIIAESGWSHMDENIAVLAKLQVNPADVSYGIAQMKLRVASQMLNGHSDLSNKEFRELGRELREQPALAIELAAQYLQSIKQEFDQSLRLNGMSVSDTRETSDFAANIVSRRDYEMALMAGYNLGTERLSRDTYQEGTDKILNKAHQFIEMARHNYVTGVDVRARYPEHVLKALGLERPNVQETQRAADWEDYVLGRRESF